MILDCYQTFAAMYVDYFNKYGEERMFKFVFGSKFSLSVLEKVYLNLIKDESVTCIEQIPIEKKQKYWDIGCKYFTDLPNRLKATKAVYVLELITSTY